MQAAQERPLLSCHRDDLYRSGLNDETIEAAGFYSATRQEAKELLGLDPGSGGWVIPYPHRTGLDDLIHFKPDIPLEDQKGKKRKYLFPKGSQSRVYVPPMLAVETLQSKRITLYIVEGEKKALKAAQEGLCCIAIPGVWNWKYRDEHFDSRTIPDLFHFFLKGREVKICFDSDLVENISVAHAEYQLAQKLKTQGAIVSGIRLPAGPKGEKVGLDDYLLTHSKEQFKTLQCDSLEYPPKQSRINGKGKADFKEDWPPLIPFDDYSKLPAFPVEMFPGIGRAIIEAAAECYQVDAGLPATVFLGVLATTLQKKFEVILGETHKEPVNLFLASVLPSGERKSPNFGEMTLPIFEYQKEQAESMASKIREAEIAHFILNERLKDQKTKAAKAKTSEDRKNLAQEAIDTAQELSESPIIKAPVYLVDDVTPESLGIEMSENGEKMSIMSAEGEIFSILAGRYSGSPNLGLCLKAFSGDHYGNNRVGRKSYSMASPALTIGITVQPDIIAEIGQNKTFRGLGLLARILYSIDSPRAGYRPRTKKSISPEIRQKYSRHIKALLTISQESPHVLKLTLKANQVWDEFYNEIEISMRPGGQLETLKDWGSKLPGNVARIAGLLHCAEHEGEATKKDISAETTINAVVIGRYYLAHALAAFGIMKQDPQIEAAKKILEYLIDKNPATFKGRDVLRNKNHFKKIDEVNEGLPLLEERGYIRKTSFEPVRNGRPPAPEYEVNPEIKTA